MKKHGKDPINNEPLTIDECININVSSTKQSNFNSIPSLLSLFQNEWDSIILENFQLKKKINNLEKDLANSVYHYDASIRVISRLSKERDEAVRNLQHQLLGTKDVSDPDDINRAPEVNQVSDINSLQDSMDVDPSAAVKVSDSSELYEQPDPIDLLQPIIDADKFLNTIHQKQLKEHKSSLSTNKHTISLNVLLPPTAIEGFNSTNKLLNSSLLFNNDLLMINSKSNVFVLNLSINSIINTFSIKTLNPSNLLQALNFINVNTTSDPVFKPILGFDDGQVMILDTDLSKRILEPADVRLLEIPQPDAGASVVSLLSHPSLNNYLIQVFSNGVWNIINCHSKDVIFSSRKDNSANFEYNSADLHMDGSLLAIGTTNGLILIYDLKTGNRLTVFQETLDDDQMDDSVINNLVFANNGYWLLSTITSYKKKTSKINIWDLRKGQIATTINSNKIIKKITLDRFSQILIILFGDNNVEFFKYLKKSKEWVQDPQLSKQFSQQFLTSKSSKVNLVDIFWQKTFERTGYVIKSDGKWGKFALTFE